MPIGAPPYTGKSYPMGAMVLKHEFMSLNIYSYILFRFQLCRYCEYLRTIALSNEEASSSHFQLSQMIFVDELHE
jgi:hypothetical protein